MLSRDKFFILSLLFPAIRPIVRLVEDGEADETSSSSPPHKEALVAHLQLKKKKRGKVQNLY